MKPFSFTKVFIFLLLLCTFSSFVFSEDSKKNAFREREASDDALGYPEMYSHYCFDFVNLGFEFLIFLIDFLFLLCVGV
jgi:hypothetical protein